MRGEPADRVRRFCGRHASRRRAGSQLAVREILSGPRRERPDAIVCANDQMAIGAIRELQLAGVRAQPTSLSSASTTCTPAPCSYRRSPRSASPCASSASVPAPGCCSGSPSRTCPARSNGCPPSSSSGKAAAAARTPARPPDPEQAGEPATCHARSHDAGLQHAPLCLMNAKAWGWAAVAPSACHGPGGGAKMS